MPVANQLRESMKRSSWIREMFEEGARLKAIHGEDQVHDFSLGNPILEPPQQVHRTEPSPTSGGEPMGTPTSRAAPTDTLAPLPGSP